VSIAGNIARNTTLGIITYVLELGITFVVGIILARSLGTEQYGVYAYVMWFLNLTLIITNLGLGEMNRRFIPEAMGRQRTREPSGFIQIMLVFRIAAALVVSSVILITPGYWARLSGDANNQMLFILIGLTILPNALQFAFIGIFQGFQKFEYVLYISLAMFPLRLILVIILMYLGFGVKEIVILNIATLLIGVISGVFLLRRLVPLKSLLYTSLLPKDTKKQALRYSFAIAGTLILGYLVNNQAEVFFIGLFCPVEAVGFYNLAYRLGSMSITIIPLAFGIAILPSIAEQFGKGENDKIKSIYLTSARYFMIVALPLAAGVIALAEAIIILLYGVDYTPAVILLQVLTLPLAIFGITYAADSVIRGINHPGFILITMAIFAVIKVGLSLWLIPRYGVLGAAIASSVPRVITLPVYIIFLYKRIKAIWPIGDTIKIATASLIMGIAIYALQSQLGVILSLVLCIPLGIVIYVIAIIFLKVVREQDVAILKGIQNTLPMTLRRYYIPLVGLIERVVARTSRGTERTE
jgi:O-antigen/teichoic acid export membrane protein